MPDTKKQVEKYMKGVRSGKIVAGKLVRLAVDRQFKDLRLAGKRGLCFDEEAAQIVVDFFGLLRHSKGKWAGQPFVLSDWELFIVWVVFGWRWKKTKKRRFTIAYVEVARKNGKSTFAAGIGLYLMAGDGEPVAEVYSVATKMEQARIIHKEAMRMVRKSPSLKKAIGITKYNLCEEATESTYDPLGRDADSTDGLNIHGATIDEVHAHKSREMWDVIETGVGAREQPLILATTTAGYNTETICYELRDYGVKNLEGYKGFQDDTFFAFIAALDKGDDWKNEAVWPKANPDLHNAVNLDELRRAAYKAKNIPSSQNNFRRKRMNEWVGQENRWIMMDKWEACQNLMDEKKLVGRECFGGLDLSSNVDISSFSLCFPLPDDSYKLRTWFWIPKENAMQREKNDRVPYTTWEREGWITLTEGNSIDFNYIRHKINELAKVYKIREIGYDPWQALHIATDLTESDGFMMTAFRGGYQHLNEPSKKFESLILNGKLDHGNNPILTWMASNVSIRTHPETDSIRPVKPEPKSAKKIDGIVASIFAIGRAMFSQGDPESVYDKRGLREL